MPRKTSTAKPRKTSTAKPRKPRVLPPPKAPATLYSEGAHGIVRMEVDLIEFGFRNPEERTSPFAKFIPRGDWVPIQWRRKFRPFALLVAGWDHPDPASPPWAATRPTQKDYVLYDPRFRADFSRDFADYLATAEILIDFRPLPGADPDDSPLVRSGGRPVAIKVQLSLAINEATYVVRPLTRAELPEGGTRGFLLTRDDDRGKITRTVTIGLAGLGCTCPIRKERGDPIEASCEHIRACLECGLF